MKFLKSMKNERSSACFLDAHSVIRMAI